MSAAERRAALELHGLAARDRDWVLGQLTAPERASLEALLTELDEMGLRFDLTGPEGALDALGPMPSTGGRTPAAGEVAPSLATLRGASPERMIRLLAGEPAWLVAAVLRIEAWPWSAAVRAALLDDGRLREPTLGAQRPLPRGLAAALPALLVERLMALAPAPVVANPASGSPAAGRSSAVWGRVRNRVASWLK